MINRQNDNGDRYLTTQHERDAETGLDYRGARYYDSDVARFLSTDPWQAKYPSWSTYNYCMGNPIFFIDPTGKGVEGDYYGSNGKWVASDGKNDGRVYHADKNGDVQFGFGPLKEYKFKEWKPNLNSTFEGYLPQILGHEGGFVNDPDDPGGATNMGITLNVFKKHAESLLGINGDLANLRHLSPSQAGVIYQEKYWNTIDGNNIADKQVAGLFLDTHINGGGLEVMKKSLGALGVTGITSSNLTDKINSVNGEELFNTYKAQRIARYDRLIENNPRLQKFENGWKNRTNSFVYEK